MQWWSGDLRPISAGREGKGGVRDITIMGIVVRLLACCHGVIEVTIL